MSKLSTDSYKGVRDFYPEEQFIQNYIFGVWKKSVESSGYEECSASILEPSEIYKEKSGDEIVNEQTFTFTDRGGREVTLRPEMTPTIARMVAARKRELGYPLRWYSIPNVFRYEAPQRGRLREHWQLNMDIFGVKGIEADIEMIAVAYNCLKNFGAKDEYFEIRINTNSGNMEEVNQVITGLKYSGITNVRFDETLKRGQAYYTGVVYEFFDTNPKNSRSIFGGGRYDDLLSLFSNETLPAVGIAAGDVTMRDFLETYDLLPKYKPATHIFLTLKQTSDAQSVVKFFDFVNKLKETGANIATDLSYREAGDLYKTAEKLHIPYISFVDSESDELVIKNMETREEKTFGKSDYEEISEFLRN
jgi:histidyl-tRNA synthetase